MDALTTGYIKLKDTNRVWWNDIDVVMSAVEAPDMYALEYIEGGALLDTESAVLRIVAFNGMLIQYSSARMRSNRTVFARAVYSTTDVVEFFGGAFVDDERMMTYAVSINGMVLEFASERLRSNVNVISAAVAQNARAVAFIIDKK